MAKTTQPETDILKPYTGPEPSANNFAQAFPEIEKALTGMRKGVALEADTQVNLDEFKRNVRANPPRPATVINLHPFDLQISHSTFARGILVPACVPGKEYEYRNVRGWMYDWKYVDGSNGVRSFHLIKPIDRAREFVQTFNNKDQWGSGVIIYEGETNPEKAGAVETYDNDGRPLTVSEMRFEVDDDTDQRTPIKVPIPIKKPLRELIEAAIDARNHYYLRVVQEADHDYNLKDGKGRKRDFNIPRLMAEVLQADGLISEPPNWNLSTRLEKGQAQDNCPSCGEPYKAGAFRHTCGWILDPVAAYENGAIEYGNMRMETMTSDEWTAVEKIKAERDKVRNKREKAAEKAAKNTE